LHQTRQDIVGALILCFKTLGYQKYLQLYNKLPSCGSSRYPHSFGLVIRFCLYIVIEPVFIPIKEPLRNGIVKHFNNVFDKSFYRSHFFKSFLHLYSKAKVFEAFHNGNHRYSSLSGKTPNEFACGNLVKLPNSFKVRDPLLFSSGIFILLGL
jgi:putative transposase